MITKTQYDDISFKTRRNSTSDQPIIKEILDQNVYRLHDNMIVDSGVVLDIGANIGVFTIDILRRAKNNGKPVTIYAVEPEKNNLALLEANLERNAHLMEESKVVIVPYAIGGARQSVHISDSHGGSRISEKGQLVRMITLDQLFEEYGITSVDFMKIDIEGSEIPTLLAASDNTIDAVKRSAIEFDEQNGIEKFAQVINRFCRKCSFGTLGVPARGCYIYTERHI